MFKLIKTLIKKEKINQEAFCAYLDRLPDNINVSWFRDGKYIVGKVIAGDKKFTTQGLSANDFIEMVNDSVFTVYDIPKEYFGIISVNKIYLPNKEQRAKLDNKNINYASFGSEKLVPCKA